ncbi:lipoate--protein ligase family protein [Alkalibacillus almallahensis]|uniref:lipoate--protein ligase family protein n=1 Tax=Alkalibacillus almallahensis TaxID=1379154 RepID=UPI001421CB8B|nr:lipoate--protein ligase family protein [Alkalibacillus almallahensis]NIK11532.1 lipoate-protein ligase A [Alkalibacillus almallahensis]
MEREWLFLDTGYHDAAVNMALDECLINWLHEGRIQPTLRFYGWEKPSLSIGHFQKAEKTIDFSAVNKHSCQFVRRLTGGSAVLHDHELTYSLVISEQDPGIPQSVKDAYYILSKGVLEGYKNLGIEADYAIPDEQVARGQSAICFEEPTYYEMVADGKKLSGNAQTRKNGVLMQHGSIPITMNTDMLFDLFRFQTEESRARKHKAFQNKAVTINQLTDQHHTYETMTAAFKKGFSTGLNITFRPLELSERDWEEVFHLANTKYKSEAWNFHLSKERVTSGQTS